MRAQTGCLLRDAAPFIRAIETVNHILNEQSGVFFILDYDHEVNGGDMAALGTNLTLRAGIVLQCSKRCAVLSVFFLFRRPCV